VHESSLGKQVLDAVLERAEEIQRAYRFINGWAQPFRAEGDEQGEP
jgi:hypothetical protein